MAEDICRALVFIQKQGLIHRDIKPANIFVDSLGQFKLGDFGVARTAELTMGGMSKQGTENYMAPEVYHGKPYGASVDIYSLGLVLYRMMNANRLPFYPPAPQRIGLADRENALISRMKGEPLPAPAQASPEFAQIILKACAHDPKERYQTAGQMLEALTGKETVVPTRIVESCYTDEQSQQTLTEQETVIPQKPVEHTQALDDSWEGEYDETLNVFAQKVASDEEDGGTIGIFTPKPAVEKVVSRTTEEFVKKPIPEVKQTIPEVKKPVEGESRREAMLAFWQQNLTKLWGVKKDASWKAYFAPNIPLQICSNAIFNITESREKKDQILAILDCTPDDRVPCGGGIVVTPDRMYINLLMQNANAQKYPVAVLEFDQLKQVWSGIQKGPLWIKYPSLYWETNTGKSYSFGVSMYPFVNYGTLEKLLSSDQWKACLETE